MNPPRSDVRLEFNDTEINRDEMYLKLLAINAFKKVSINRAISFEKAPFASQHLLCRPDDQRTLISWRNFKGYLTAIWSQIYLSANCCEYKSYILKSTICCTEVQLKITGSVETWWKYFCTYKYSHEILIWLSLTRIVCSQVVKIKMNLKSSSHTFSKKIVTTCYQLT